MGTMIVPIKKFLLPLRPTLCAAHRNTAGIAFVLDDVVFVDRDDVLPDLFHVVGRMISLGNGSSPALDHLFIAIMPAAGIKGDLRYDDCQQDNIPLFQVSHNHDRD